MNKLFLIFFILCSFLYSNNSSIEVGKGIFKSKGCSMCHKRDKKGVGPSLSIIYKRYSGKETLLVDFLKGKSKAIIYPGRAPIMQAQLTKLKGLSTQNTRYLARYLITIDDREF